MPAASPPRRPTKSSSCSFCAAVAHRHAGGREDLDAHAGDAALDRALVAGAQGLTAQRDRVGGRRRPVARGLLGGGRVLRVAPCEPVADVGRLAIGQRRLAVARGQRRRSALLSRTCRLMYAAERGRTGVGQRDRCATRGRLGADPDQRALRDRRGGEARRRPTRPRAPSRRRASWTTRGRVDRPAVDRRQRLGRLDDRGDARRGC